MTVSISNAPDFLYSLSLAHRLITQRMPGIEDPSCSVRWNKRSALVGLTWSCRFVRGDETRVTARFAFNYGFSVSLINIDTSVPHNLSRNVPRASLLISDVTRKRIENERVQLLFYFENHPLQASVGHRGKNDVGYLGEKWWLSPWIIKRSGRSGCF